MGKIGHIRKPKSTAAHPTARSHVAWSSTLALVGRTRMPTTLQISVCAYHVMNISPFGRSASTRHRSFHVARISHCLAGGCSTKSCFSFGDTKARPSSISPAPVVAFRLQPRQAYREISMRIQPRAWTSALLPWPSHLHGCCVTFVCNLLQQVQAVSFNQGRVLLSYRFVNLLWLILGSLTSFCHTLLLCLSSVCKLTIPKLKLY